MHIFEKFWSTKKNDFFFQKAVYTKSKNINVLLLAINNTTKMKIPYNIWIQYYGKYRQVSTTDFF